MLIFHANFSSVRCDDGERINDPLTGALLELLDEPKELPEPITVPYLNPLVLRKELENVLSQEGDACLTKHRFILEHPIVYWNLIWYFERINLTSHLPELWLNDSEEKDFHSNAGLVGVRTMWDNEKLHMDRLPMYLQWKQNITEDRTFVASYQSYAFLTLSVHSFVANRQFSDSNISNISVTMHFSKKKVCDILLQRFPQAFSLRCQF